MLFSSHLTQCLGHWGLQGMRTMVFSHWKGTGMFAAKPSSWLQCLQIRAESKASRPSILGVWSWMAPEGVCVCVWKGVSCSIIHRAQLLTTVCFSSGALSFCGTLFLSDELICRILCVRSSSVVQVEDRRAISVPNTTPCPMAGHISESTLHPHCVDVGGKAWSGTHLSQDHKAS